ncbi:hypothetical protein GGF46_005527 [Coemansia sp. RSA 552]|nr:hypothetical protein GGF46_005527 [Coemansia sp. RSA 552]
MHSSFAARALERPLSLLAQSPRPDPTARAVSAGGRPGLGAGSAPTRLIFIRRPKPPPAQPPPHPQSLSGASDDGYEPGSDSDGYSSPGEAAPEEDPDGDLRYALCQELPFWHCFFTPDTHEFLWSSSPAREVRPTTIMDERLVYDQKEYRPATPEIVKSIIEYLQLLHRSDICLAVIPFERRLPELGDFIWRLFDGTGADMWTALSCVILLKRIYAINPTSYDTPYEARHSLFLGVFVLAATSCVYTNHPETFAPKSIADVLQTWYRASDIVKITLETFSLMDNRAWISLAHILGHASNNMYDIHKINSSHQDYNLRQSQRMILEEHERRYMEERRRRQDDLRRFMYRSPHDTLCSWNTQIMNVTEDRFLYRHLPWFFGMITPVHVTATSEEARVFLNRFDQHIVFSPLLPTLRSRVSGGTQ